MDSEGLSSKFADDQEVFEIRDYTTASEWERFTASFEEILNDWKLTGDKANIVKIKLNAKDMENVKWHEQNSTISFLDYLFHVTHHYVSLEEMDKSNEFIENVTEGNEPFPEYLSQTLNTEVDFAIKSHCITRWFGLQQFIILSADPSMPTLVSHSRTRVLLSSLAIAASNTNCQIPLFVQTRNPEDKVFNGVAISNGLRTDFDMSYVQKFATGHSNLDGIMNLLREKLGLAKNSRADLAIKFTYNLCDWPSSQLVQPPKPEYDPLSLTFNFEKFIEFPFGTFADPVSELFVSTFRSKFNCSFDDPAEKTYRSTLDPNFLRDWAIRLTAPNYMDNGRMSNIMKAFLITCENPRTVQEILGGKLDPPGDDAFAGALNKLTETPIPSMRNVLFKNTSKLKSTLNMMPTDVLQQILMFIFPDLYEKESKKNYPTEFSQVPQYDRKYKEMPEEPPLKTVLSNIKSCPIDSFVWRVMFAASYCVMSMGICAVAELLSEIYRELGSRWNNSIILPGVETDLPNLATCLFNQKIQLLNYCIQKRRYKEGKALDPKFAQTEVESEGEFYECNSGSNSDCSDENQLPEWDKPTGRLRRLGDLRLLNSRSFLYIPVTQDMPPVTEDRLEQQKDDLVRLGSDATASHHRARVMSVSLQSDMESFKAANPEAVLADFVRWYSPRDWSQDEGSDTGHLSERMLAPGNLWQDTWQNAVPVPAHRQRRLFDETREAQSVLRWIADLEPGIFLKELLPVLAHACLARIIEEPILFTMPASISCLPMPLHCRTLFAQLELLAQRALRISRNYSPEIATYEGLLERFRAIEIDITRAKSLRFKLLGHVELSSAAFKCSSSPSVATSEQDDTAQPVKIMFPSTIVLTKEEEEEMLEKLIYNLLTNQEIPVDDSPTGPQARAIIKLFQNRDNLEENQEGNDTAVGSDRPNRKDASVYCTHYSRPNVFILGPPVAREYLIRVKSKFPSGFSRILPHRMFVVSLPTGFRMSGAITQDTIFC